jgi:hypothetical protein
MRIVKIPKKKPGEYRTIYVPNREEKRQYQLVVGRISQKSKHVCQEGIVHGFMRQCSPVTNAQAHIGYQHTTCFDLKDFFDSVSEPMLKSKLTREELALVLVDGAARQGLPTSPSVANLAASDMDQAILKWIKKNEYKIVYTRYADDLSFSYNDAELSAQLLQHIPQIVRRCGFQINPSKTHTLNATRGRRIITGVAADMDGVYPTRHVKRKLRAALHQQNLPQAAGLAEWCKLKLPKADKSSDMTSFRTTIAEWLQIKKVWNLPNVPIKKLPKKETLDLGRDCIITGDPVYIAGMSTWTNGWTSCMAQPRGQYRKGVIFWMLLRGARIATYLSEKTMVVAGVERRVMRARALVYDLVDGNKCYDRIYGNYGDTDHLRNVLQGAGIVPINNARLSYGHGIAVEGYVLRKYRPYLDSLYRYSCNIKDNLGQIQQVWKVKI